MSTRGDPGTEWRISTLLKHPVGSDGENARRLRRLNRPSVNAALVRIRRRRSCDGPSESLKERHELGKECTPVKRVLLSCKMEVVELVEAAGVGILLVIESAQVTDFTFRENHHNCSNRRMGTRNTHAANNLRLVISYVCTPRSVPTYRP